MKQNMKLVIGTGGTSAIMRTALSKFVKQFKNVHVIVQDKNKDLPAVLCQKGVTTSTLDEAKEQSLIGKDTVVFWLSPHDDVDLLKAFTELSDNVVLISSCGIVTPLEEIAKRQSAAEIEEYIKTTTPYQQGKVRMEQVKGVIKLFPGFYLQDLPFEYIDGLKGLHTESSYFIFGNTKTEKDDAFWNRKYSVTPMSGIVQVLLNIAENPEEFKKDEHWFVCSNGEYSRRQLKSLSLGEDVEEPKDVYSTKKYHAADFPHDTIKESCKRARELNWDDIENSRDRSKK